MKGNFILEGGRPCMMGNKANLEKVSSMSLGNTNLRVSLLKARKVGMES